jgi:hypothetical protein
MDECGRPTVAVAVDAISVSHTFVGMCGMTRETESYMFPLNLQPIHPGIPCRPIHVLGSETGNANQSIQRQITEMIVCLKNAKISVLGIAFDGDRGYSACHENSLISGMVWNERMACKLLWRKSRSTGNYFPSPICYLSPGIGGHVRWNIVWQSCFHDHSRRLHTQRIRI